MTGSLKASSNININGQGVTLNSACHGSSESGSSRHSTIIVNEEGVALISSNQRNTMSRSSVNSMPKEHGQGRTVGGSSNNSTENINRQGVNSFGQINGVFGLASNLIVSGNLTMNGKHLRTSPVKLNSGSTQTKIFIGNCFTANNVGGSGTSYYGSGKSGSSSYSTINVNEQDVSVNSSGQRSTMSGSSLNSKSKENGQDVFLNATYQGRTLVGSSNNLIINGQNILSNSVIFGNVTITGNNVRISPMKSNSGATQSGMFIRNSFNANNVGGSGTSFMASEMRISGTGFKTSNMRVSNLRGERRLNKRKKSDANRRF